MAINKKTKWAWIFDLVDIEHNNIIASFISVYYDKKGALHIVKNFIAKSYVGYIEGRNLTEKWNYLKKTNSWKIEVVPGTKASPEKYGVPKKSDVYEVD